MKLNYVYNKLLIFSFCFFTFNCFAQYNKIKKVILVDKLPSELSYKEEVYLNIISEHFNNSHYLRALPFTDSLLNLQPNNNYYKYLKAIAYSFNYKYYNDVQILFNELSAFKDSLEDFDLFYANFLWLKGDYNMSAEFFKKYLNQIPTLEEYKEYALNKLMQYEQLNKQLKYIQKVTLKNLDNINTSDHEYAPVISADGNRLYFTYRGEQSVGGKQITAGQKDENKGVYFEDIFVAQKINDSAWQKPQPIKELNTFYHEAILSISQDEKKAFLYRNKGGGTGDIFYSEFKDGKWKEPEKLKGDVNTSSWEGSAFLSPDGQTLYFSSERPGGYGGKDLYKAKLINGKWKNIENLGPVINTKADEDSPVLFANGSVLFFSSNGHRSIGGFDIFRSDYVDGNWTQPINLGTPINTTNDDIFFSITADGKKAYLSSDRRGGKGKQDIYEVSPGFVGKPVKILIVKGKINYDFKPVQAKIEIKSKINTEFKYEPIISNSNGEYSISLPTQDEFILQYFLNDSVYTTRNVSTEVVDTISFLKLDVDFFSDSLYKEFKYDENKEKIIKTEYEEFNINDPDITTVFKKSVPDLLFKIQIGAYRNEENFDFSKLINLYTVHKEYDKQDKLVRFFIGPYSTIEQAFEGLYDLKKRKLEDSFIKAFYKGEEISFKKALEILEE